MAKKPAKKLTLGDRIAADPKLKARYLNDPGLRSKLDPKFLTPAQRKVRQTNAYNAIPITEGSSVTNQQLAAEAASATRVRYGPQEQALQTQQQRATSLGNDQNSWYDAYRAELATHAANTQAIGAAAVAQDQQLAQGARGLDQTQATAQQQQMQADAATRGGTVDPSLAKTASDASAVRQQMLAGFGSQQAATGAAHSQYADTLAHVVAPTQQLQARAQSANKVQDIVNQITALQGDKGAYDQSYRTGRVTDEQKTVLSKQALGLDVQKAQTTAALGAARIKETHRATTVRRQTADANRTAQQNSPSAQKTQADLDFFKKHGYYPPTGSPKGAKTDAAHTRKTAANDKTRSTITTAKADAAYLKTQKIPVRGPDGKPQVSSDGKTPTGATRTLTEPEIRAALRKKYKDADIANAAMDLALLGHISPENQRRLRARGIGVPRDWLPKTVRKTGTVGALTPLSTALGGGSTVTKKPPVKLGP
jgi:hypothetical protein